MTHTLRCFRQVHVVHMFRGVLGLGLCLALGLVLVPASPLLRSSSATVPACSPVSGLPCTIGGNLEILSGSFGGSGAGGGGGGATVTFTADPLNPGFTITANKPTITNANENSSGTFKR